MKNNNKKYNIFLGIGLLILVFAFCAPYIFTQFHSDVVFGEQTGQIGDTIGGITTPFLNILGSILVYLAFRAQIDANDDIRHRELAKELKEKQERDTDIYNKMELLTDDLDSMSKDIGARAAQIKTFYENEKKYPFKMNVLRRASYKSYYRTLEIDRLDVYKGYKLLLGSKPKWIKDYKSLYNMLDFFPEFLEDLYGKADLHAKDLYDKKMVVRQKLLNIMDITTNFLVIYTMENPMLGVEKTPKAKITAKLSGYAELTEEKASYYEVANNLVVNYTQMTAKDVNETGEIITKLILKKWMQMF